MFFAPSMNSAFSGRRLRAQARSSVEPWALTTAFLKLQRPPSSSAVATPEPSTWVMLLLGFAGLGFAGRRKAKNAAAFVI